MIRQVFILFSLLSNYSFSQSCLTSDTMYYKDGKVKSVSCKMERGASKTTGYFEDGTVSSEIEYYQGKKNGLSIHYYPDGCLKSRYSYQNGLRQGVAETRFPNGQIDFTGLYENDKKINHWIHYFKTGGKQSEEDYKNGLKNGQSISYRYDGSKFQEYNSIAGKFQGKSFEYYKNGKIFREVTFKDNWMVGKLKTYYQNGNVCYEIGYKNGRETGGYICYTENGELAQGDFIAYDSDSFLRLKATCNKGRPEGEVKQYLWASLYCLSNYNNGKLNGEMYFYSYGEKLIMTRTYKNGKLVSERFEPKKEPEPEIEK